MKRKRALVFAGAGASTAVDREQYPTTVAFYQKLPQKIKDNEFIQAIEGWVRNTHGAGKSPLDIEVVLWAVEELSAFIDKLSSPDFPFYALRSNLLTEWTRVHQSSPMPAIGAAVSKYSSLMPTLEQLRSEINQKVYDLYAQLPTSNQLAGNWLPLLEGLRESGFQVEIATTNYDLIIEQALELVNWDLKPATGRPDTGVYRYLDLGVWRNPLRPGGALTKLHGSVDWSYMSGGQILFGNPQFKADHSRHAIIYPGFKGVPKAEEMILFHNYFAQAVSASDLLIFIGFAFRDQYLNQVIVDNLSPSAKILILNPEASLLSLPFDDSQATLIPKYFDLESVSECIDLAAKFPV
jgi:hypothetical protein